jgi:hypothetical protein
MKCGQLCGHFVSLPQPYGFGHITDAYPTSLSLRLNSSLRSELRICLKTLAEMSDPALFAKSVWNSKGVSRNELREALVRV